MEWFLPPLFSRQKFRTFPNSREKYRELNCAGPKSA
jgi:hypothetical protein